MEAPTIKLYNDDCLDCLASIKSNHVDLIITSPPYDNIRSYNDSSVWNFDIFKNIADELHRVLKDGGTIVWIVSDATVKGSETGTSFRQALYFKEIGLNLHDTMIWKKPTFTAVGSIKSRYAPTFEYMFVFTKEKLKTFNPINDRKNKTFGCKKHGAMRQKNGDMKPLSNIGKPINEYGIRHNVWEINTENNNTTGHPAPFPLKLVHDHIISWTNENDIVLDCFMGSGTTGLACKILNRNFIGIEIDQEYFKKAEERINNVLI